jgi:hypothetical protein
MPRLPTRVARRTRAPRSWGALGRAESCEGQRGVCRVAAGTWHCVCVLGVWGGGGPDTIASSTHNACLPRGAPGRFLSHSHHTHMPLSLIVRAGAWSRPRLRPFSEHPHITQRKGEGGAWIRASPSPARPLPPGAVPPLSVCPAVFAFAISHGPSGSMPLGSMSRWTCAGEGGWGPRAGPAAAPPWGHLGPHTSLTSLLLLCS